MHPLAMTSLVLAAALATGCETAPSGAPAGDTTAAAAPTSASRACVREPRTGSNLPSRECQAAMSEAEKAQALENMRAKNPSTSTVRSSSGG